MEDALLASQIRVKAMTEFVRKGEHIATATRPVEQQVRVCAWDGVSTERTWTLAWSHGCVDPVLIDEGVHDTG
ncbi:unannotated protein [freshwater metagenome]|uniref:Unannotated protein n=1 Tax=freshwater metagenome TaxID=449393 RepID=A0A6J6JU18_9ZZZZ